jgi:CMP-N-acetylneuraminic acid synthetase
MSYAIEACKRTKLIDDVYVSTESDIIAKIADEYGAKVVKRPERLAEDDVSTQDVFKHFAKKVKDFDILVGVQANSPNAKTENIDKAIKKLIKYNLWEVRSVSSDGLENGAFWVLKRDAIFWSGLSVYFGVVVENAIDVHTMFDLKKAEELIENG